MAGMLRRLLAVSAATSVIGAGCTGAPSSVQTTEAPVGLFGSIDSLVATSSASSIERMDLSSGEVFTVKAPVPVEAVNLGAVASWTGSGRSWLVAAGEHDVQTYEVTPGRSPVPVGPKLRFSGSSPEIAIGSSGAVVATCRGVFTRSLTTTGDWVRAGEGCWAAVSDDGHSLAYSPDGRHLVIGSFDGSNQGPTQTVDLERALRPLLGGQASDLRLVGRPAWSDAGLAFVVRARGQVAIFVRQPSGKIVKVLQEVDANTYREPRLAWQPNGTALAISDDVGPAGAVLRIFDTSDGSLRAVGADVIGFAGLLWSPDGEALAVLTSASALVVLALDGTWLLRRETDWKRLMSWTGPA
jgi:hypothetical protein